MEQMTLVCEFCEQPFSFYARLYRNGRRKYCSNDCRHKAHTLKRRQFWNGMQPPYLKREKRMAFCEFCQKQYHQKRKVQRFCSIACANKAQFLGKPKKPKKTYSRKRTDTWAQVETVCDYCGKTFSIAKWNFNRSKKHFCRDNDNACYGSWCSENRRGRNHPCFGKAPSKRAGRGRGGFVQELGHYVRSTWEANVARYFKSSGIEYIYEPETFDFGEFTYTPDFFLPVRNQYVEVKGVWTKKARQQVKAFQNTGRDLWIIDSPVYASLGFDPEETK